MYSLLTGTVTDVSVMAPECPALSMLVSLFNVPLFEGKPKRWPDHHGNPFQRASHLSKVKFVKLSI